MAKGHVVVMVMGVERVMVVAMGDKGHGGDGGGHGGWESTV